MVNIKITFCWYNYDFPHIKVKECYLFCKQYGRCLLMEMGHVIAKQREEKGLSQKELARILNVSSSAVALWEVNKRCPSLDSLIEIADFFNISMDVLFASDRKNKNYVPIQYQNYSDKTERIIEYFQSMNEESQDILIGEARKLLREQRLEEKRGTDTLPHAQ